MLFTGNPILVRDAQGELRTNLPTTFIIAPLRDGTGHGVAALGLRIGPGAGSFGATALIALAGSWAIGAGAAVLGHPAAAIAMLANHLGARGEELPAGTMILSGGVTEAVAVAAGDHVSLRIQSLGSVGLHFI